VEADALEGFENHGHEKDGRPERELEPSKVSIALCSDIEPCCIDALWMLVKKTPVGK
jgi:hypothetical protein